MKHLAIIADGNRRWAKTKGINLVFGYDKGVSVVERCCEWCIENSLDFLTVYCFSTENWSRPAIEVRYLISLGKRYFAKRGLWYVEKGIRIKFSGRRDRLDDDVLEKISQLEKITENGTKLTLVVCLDYGGRDEIARAIEAGARTEEEIDTWMNAIAPAPDAILRTGGDKRLSNFLLWQSAYAELFFSDIFFPDLNKQELDLVLQEYKKRKRTYGK
jgi:undecaprenyl diphosphate synthase